jgi:glycosyltransferase involved in cell wall biosynthesis
MKSLALVAILKNEKHNLEQFLSSFKGCVDHVYLCDTGSTDGSVEWIEKNASLVVGCPVSLTHFAWINDFSAARNFAAKNVKEHFWMWADLDDVLAEKENFLAWKENAMHLADMWFAPYFYGWNGDNPVCKFVRERVFRNSFGFQFSDMIHEGVKPKEGCTINGVQTWRIDHKRTTEEASADRGRNLEILKENFSRLSPRLMCYLGKEYYDNQMPKEAAQILEEAIKYPESVLDLSDRTMALQYLCQSYFISGNLPDVIKLAKLGTQIDPLRAEFFCLTGDAYFAQDQFAEALPWYAGAANCMNRSANGMSKMFTFDDMYSNYPKTQMAKIYFNLQNYVKAKSIAMEVGSEECQEIVQRISAIEENKTSFESALPCDDIVFTCLFNAYPWDEKIYQEKGIGGSETACVEMAAQLKSKTDRQVKVFQERENVFVSESGVVYVPLKLMTDYFRKWKPALHIAWRHAHKITEARTLTWSHDLMTPGVEHSGNKVICLSPFHKGYVQAMQGVGGERVMMSRNGLREGRFDGLDVTNKVYGKVIWPNSPDRGLEYAISVMDEVVKDVPEATLHVFYGFENLRKYGQGDLAERLEKMILERPWIHYHGNVDQTTLAKEMASSVVWLYTANFIETFCITALEALACKAFPIVREIGALQDTLKEANDRGECFLLDMDTTKAEVKAWALSVIHAIKNESWKKIDYDIGKHSWSSVATEWIKELDL